MNILLIEDNPTLSANIQTALRAEGFAVDTVYDGLLAERMLQQKEFDCLIMDINLPGKTGFDLCRDFRRQNTHTPILMLTAFGELKDKVKGFDCGADDYLTKPFFMRELLLRIHALIKRGQQSRPEREASMLTAGDIAIDTARKEVSRQGTPVALTPREYQILNFLAERPGEVISKAALIKEIWGHSFQANTNTIEVYINFLRNKLDKPFGKNSIKTKVGYGYYLDVS